MIVERLSCCTASVLLLSLILGCDRNPEDPVVTPSDAILVVTDMAALRQHLTDGTVRWDSVVEMSKGERRFVIDHIVRRGDVVLLEYAIGAAGREAAQHVESCYFIAEAATACNWPLVEWLIVENGADPNCFTGSGRAPLFVSLRCGIDFVAALVHHGADLHIRHVLGCTALYAASGCCGYEMVEFLLEQGADIAANESDECPYGSPLHAAADECRLDVMTLLLSVGADVNRRRPDTGDTPLHTVCKCPQAHRLVEHLLQEGADVNVRNHDNVIPLHGAATRLWFSDMDETAAVIRLLLEAGSEIDAKGGLYDRTPLLFAAAAGSATAMKLLVEAGADVHATDRNGDCIHELAQRRYSNPSSAQGRAGLEVKAYVESLSLRDGKSVR